MKKSADAPNKEGEKFISRLIAQLTAVPACLSYDSVARAPLPSAARVAAAGDSVVLVVASAVFELLNFAGFVPTVTQSHGVRVKQFSSGGVFLTALTSSKAPR